MNKAQRRIILNKIWGADNGSLLIVYRRDISRAEKDGFRWLRAYLGYSYGYRLRKTELLVNQEFRDEFANRLRDYNLEVYGCIPSEYPGEETFEEPLLNTSEYTLYFGGQLVNKASNVDLIKQGEDIVISSKYIDLIKPGVDDIWEK